MPQQRALVFIAVHKDKFSAEAPTSSVKRYRHEEQMADRSAVWAPRMQKFAVLKRNLKHFL